MFSQFCQFQELPQAGGGSIPPDSEFPKAVLCRIGSYINYKLIQLDKSEVNRSDATFLQLGRNSEKPSRLLLEEPKNQHAT